MGSHKEALIYCHGERANKYDQGEFKTEKEKQYTEKKKKQVVATHFSASPHKEHNHPHK